MFLNARYMITYTYLNVFVCVNFVLVNCQEILGPLETGYAGKKGYEATRQSQGLGKVEVIAFCYCL